MKGPSWEISPKADKVEIDLWHEAPIPGSSDTWRSATTITLPRDAFAQKLLTKSAEARENACNRALEHAKGTFDLRPVSRRSRVARALAWLSNAPDSAPRRTFLVVGGYLGVCVGIWVADIVHWLARVFR